MNEALKAFHDESSLFSTGTISFWKRNMPPRQRLSLSQELYLSSHIQDLLNSKLRVQANPRMADAAQIPPNYSDSSSSNPKLRSKEQAKSDTDNLDYFSKDAANKISDAKKAIEALRKAQVRYQPRQSIAGSINEDPQEFDKTENDVRVHEQVLDITVQWLALNEECEAMSNEEVQRLYVAYSFLGKSGAELETPISLPKPRRSSEKCVFDFKKTFQLSNNELQALSRLARCLAPRNRGKKGHSRRDCVVFTVVSEPAEDPLAIHNCEDVGYAYLYFGDLLVRSAGSDTYTEVLPIHAAEGGDVVCGVLAIKVDGLDVVRKSVMK